MCLMIVKKWTIPWGEVDTALAPSIINQMIDLPLKLGSTSGKPLWTEQGQEDMQRFLLQLSVLMVPLILFPKPLILYFKNTCLVQPRPADEDDLLVQELRESFVTEDSAPAHKPKGHHGHAEEFEFGEIFVHQMIETIEFVLGSISNTASYLRLWALSLAHSQLAKVFFEKTLGGGVKGGSLVALLVGWALFINITFGVIMCMDMMECFLHALRLQWV
jgi:V-type H+-transporting ATPase subunit a